MKPGTQLVDTLSMKLVCHHNGKKRSITFKNKSANGGTMTVRPTQVLTLKLTQRAQTQHVSRRMLCSCRHQISPGNLYVVVFDLIQSILLHYYYNSYIHLEFYVLSNIMLHSNHMYSIHHCICRRFMRLWVSFCTLKVGIIFLKLLSW